MDAPPIPGEAGHRFALVTESNNSGYLWVASILGLIYSSLVLIVRLHIKWNLYGPDDITATMATILQLGEVVPLFVAMKRGLGRPEHLLEASQIADAGKATFVAQIFLVLALTMAKCSVAALMLRLFTRDMKVTYKSWILCNGTVALAIAWGIGSIVATTMACSPSGFIRGSTEGRCINPLTRWRIIAAFDIFIELLLFILPVIFVWPIQMKRYIKIQVIVAFGFRLPVIGFAAAHLHYVSIYANSSNIPQAMISALVYQQFELFWSLLAATIPTLKAFMRSFNSGFGMEIDLDGYGYCSGAYQNGTYPLETLQNASAPNGTVNSKAGMKVHHKSATDSSTNASRTGSENMMIYGPPVLRERSETIRTETSIYHPELRSGNGSVGSDGSQERIIKRVVEWTVRHEGAKI